MAAKIHGRLGANDLAATTNTGVYTVPSGRKATVNLTICNRNATAVTVRVAHIDGAVGAVANEDYIEYGLTVPANGTLDRTGIPMSATHTLMVYSSSTSVSAVISGVEEDV